jgi:hypothetical protein
VPLEVVKTCIAVISVAMPASAVFLFAYRAVNRTIAVILGGLGMLALPMWAIFVTTYRLGAFGPTRAESEVAVIAGGIIVGSVYMVLKVRSSHVARDEHKRPNVDDSVSSAEVWPPPPSEP